MSKNDDKMGWDEKSYYITLAIGLAIGIWCVVDFNSLDAFVNNPTTIAVAPYIVGAGLLLAIGLTIAFVKPKE